MIRAVLKYPSARVALGVIVLVALLAVFGSVIAPQDPLGQDYDDILASPTWAHLLGTDDLGRDVFSRFLAGSGISILAALEAVGVGLVLGAIPGILSVYLGRVVEWILLRIVDSLLTLPFLVFAIAIAALFGNGIVPAMFAVGVLLMPTFFRVSRAAALTVARAKYIEAAELTGASLGWIIRKHVLRTVVPAIAVTTASAVGSSLVIVSSLTFLGIGVTPPTPTWGGLLADSLVFLYQQPWGPVLPAIAIVLTVWALNALADAIRDATGVDVGPTMRSRVRGLFARRRAVAGAEDLATGAPVPTPAAARVALREETADVH
jgi:peptide/nickel transport system permease protein